jgi:hypothetical protein
LRSKPALHDALIHSLVKLFQSLSTPNQILKTFGDYIVAIQTQSGISPELNDRFEARFPQLYAQVFEEGSRTYKDYLNTLRTFIELARSKAFKFMAVFAAGGSGVAISDTPAFYEQIALSNLEKKFKRYRKLEMNEFSIWRDKNLFYN